MRVFKNLFGDGSKISIEEIYLRTIEVPGGTDIFTLEPGVWALSLGDYINMPDGIKYGFLFVISTKTDPADEITRENLYVLISAPALQLFIARPPTDWVEK